MKTLCRFIIAITVVSIISAPSFVLGYLTAVLQWNNYRIPICIAAVVLTLNLKRIWRLMRRQTVKARHGNQHTYHGVPIGALAQFLSERGSFKFEEAVSSLALSQGQYSKIASDLEKRGVLTRGEKNARVLRPIEYEMLITQLRDGFPFVFDEVGNQWVERRGSFDRWVLDREKSESKMQAAIEKKERKLDRIEKKIEQASVFETLFAHSA